MARRYQMKTRAAARDETREKIVRASMALHDEKGVAATTFADVAERAGVGGATVLRHFPTVGELVAACGRHVAAEMRPPLPETAGPVFEGLTTTRARLERLVAELDAFYRRGALRLSRAADDRDRIRELDGFLRWVDAGLEAWVREALTEESPDDALVAVTMSLSSLSVWQWKQRSGLSDRQWQGVLVDLMETAVGAVRQAME